MATVAVLGMGLLGRGFAENLVAKGHAVRVWNRTAAKAQGLGATVAATPAEAVTGAERVHLILSEDDAVDAVIAALRPGLAPGVVIVDHSTNAPAKVAARVARLDGEGVQYLHAPVFMAPANAKSATGLMLVGGDPARVAAVRAALDAMTGKVLEVGPAPDHAAKLKLTGNGAIISLACMMGDLLRMGAGCGLSPADTLGLFEHFAPTGPGMAKRVLAAGQGPASFELTMARKDVRLMIEAAGDRSLTVLPAIAAAMDAAIAAGHGSEDFAVVAKV